MIENYEKKYVASITTQFVNILDNYRLPLYIFVLYVQYMFVIYVKQFHGSLLQWHVNYMSYKTSVKMYYKCKYIDTVIKVNC